MVTQNKYTDMQKRYYEPQARDWRVDYRDPVVGSFDAHNAWEDYEFLFKDIPNLQDKVCLDFGCGPGRNLVRYADRFKLIGGVDLSQDNTIAAQKWIRHNRLDPSKFPLYVCNGYNLDVVPEESYDVIMSTICFQHICVHDIRLNYMKEFYRVLKKDGYLTFQMGFGTPSPMSVDYYDNFYDATTTNRGCDVAIASPEQLEKDLLSVGFKDFKYYIRPVGPGDLHPNWIFFNARKY